MADIHGEGMVTAHVERIAGVENRLTGLEAKVEEHCRNNVIEFTAIELRISQKLETKVEVILANIDKLSMAVTQINVYLWKVLIGLIVFFAVVVLAVLGFERLVPAAVKGFVP